MHATDIFLESLICTHSEEVHKVTSLFLFRNTPKSFFFLLNDFLMWLTICMETGRRRRWLLHPADHFQLCQSPRQVKEKKKEATDSSLDSVQRLHFTSSAQGQSVAARTAGVKRLSAPQQKQLVFPNNQALVGVLQRCRDRGTWWNCILSSSQRPPTPVSSSQPSKRKPSVVTRRKLSITITDKK